MSINKVMVLGRLGRDPEVTYTANGRAITKLAVATTETWKDTNGEKQEKTEWHRVTFFGKMAETVGSYFNKGSRIYIEGQLSTSMYEKAGEKRYSTEIVAKEFKFIDTKSERPIDPKTLVQNENVPGGFQQQQQSQPQQNGFNQQQPQQENKFFKGQQNQPQQNQQPAPDDDIPF